MVGEEWVDPTGDVKYGYVGSEEPRGQGKTGGGVPPCSQ